MTTGTGSGGAGSGSGGNGGSGPPFAQLGSVIAFVVIIGTVRVLSWFRGRPR